jgi:hypothetical protein
MNDIEMVKRLLGDILYKCQHPEPLGPWLNLRKISKDATDALDLLEGEPEELGVCYHPDNTSKQCHHECNHFDHEKDLVGDGDCHRHYLNRWRPEFEGSPCGSCGHNTTGDMMDSDKCADVGCGGNFEKWIPPPTEEPKKVKARVKVRKRAPPLYLDPALFADDCVGNPNTHPKDW